SAGALVDVGHFLGRILRRGLLRPKPRKLHASRRLHLLVVRGSKVQVKLVDLREPEEGVLLRLGQRAPGAGPPENREGSKHENRARQRQILGHGKPQLEGLNFPEPGDYSVLTIMLR